MEQILVVKVAYVIRSLRNQKRLSQEELAQRAGLDRTYLSGIERGQKNITLESLECIISGLSLTPEEFFNVLIQEL